MFCIKPVLLYYLCLGCLLLPIADCLLQVGAGLADVTGPVCQVNTMGYANAHLSGLHTRLFSRAFAFKDSNGRYAAYAVIDIAMISHLIKFVVGNRLAAETNGRYSEANVMLSATHTHAGPGGYNQDLFLVLNTPGFERKHFDYIVDGIVQSILTADQRMAPAKVFTNSGQLYNASINRHPHQYLLNSKAERAQYADNIDREMFLLRFDNAETGRPIGSVAWFPVHGTSLNMSNRYVSGDNKGVASLLMESHFGDGYVAAFSQAHSGDVTPNTRGAFNAKNGSKCDSPIVKTFDCRSKGPGKDQFESLMIIGRKQFEMALKLHQSAAVSDLVGRDPQLATVYDVRDVTSEAFPTPWTGEANNRDQNSPPLLRVCPAAFGYGFCGGTVDGYGLFDYFTMGRRQSSVLINLIRDIMGPVTPADQACHGTKQICMNAGRIMWSDIPFMSNTVPTQIMRIGQLFITALPAEMTTMSGRRLVEHLKRTSGFPKNGKVQLNGLSNGYFFYVTTEHEYNVSNTVMMKLS
uniref:Neutral ceramidase n=2 Tax=Macrostomum lignano TaxID=282301 RepID=A0A1I8I0X5_9PLAT